MAFIKRATEVSNYIPIKIDGSVTTHHELTYPQLPNLHNLPPIFSFTYLRKYKDANINRVNLEPHSIKKICVGHSPSATSLLFYHPPSKRTFISYEFTLDEILAEGGIFLKKYE